MHPPASPDPAIRKKIENITHAKSNLCWTCSTCDVECPINIATNRLRPQKIVRLANLGFIDELLSLPEIWYCLTCRRCDHVCPNLVTPSTIISYLRKEAVRRNLVSIQTLMRYRDICVRLQHIRWHSVAQCQKGEAKSIVEDKWSVWLKSPINKIKGEIVPNVTDTSEPFGDIVANTKIASCFTCSGCSGACPVLSGHSVFDPLHIFRMVYLGLEKEALRSPSIWLCLSCRRCTEVCSQAVKGHLIIERLQELAVQKGVVDNSFTFRWYQAQKSIYSHFVREIDALLTDRKLRDFEEHNDHFDINYKQEASIVSNLSWAYH